MARGRSDKIISVTKHTRASWFSVKISLSHTWTEVLQMSTRITNQYKDRPRPRAERKRRKEEGWRDLVTISLCLQGDPGYVSGGRRAFIPSPLHHSLDVRKGEEAGYRILNAYLSFSSLLGLQHLLCRSVRGVAS